MLAYVVRRVAYGFVTVLGVLGLLFVLFFLYATPEEMARRLLSHEELPAIAGDADLGAYDRKVLADFSHPDGRLKTIPSQRKKLQVILRHLIEDFDPEIRYPERQVNERLGRYHEDTATLRREMIAEGLMEREAGSYWRT